MENRFPAARSCASVRSSSRLLLLPLAVPALQQLDDDILHLLRGVAGGKVFCRRSLRMVTLRSSGFSSRMMRSMMLFSSLPSPLSCLSRWACPSDGDNLVALHDQQEVGLFFFGQVGEEIRCGNELERSCVHRVQQRGLTCSAAHSVGLKLHCQSLAQRGFLPMFSCLTSLQVGES